MIEANPEYLRKLFKNNILLTGITIACAIIFPWITGVCDDILVSRGCYTNDKMNVLLVFMVLPVLYLWIVFRYIKNIKISINGLSINIQSFGRIYQIERKNLYVGLSGTFLISNTISIPVLAGGDEKPINIFTESYHMLRIVPLINDLTALGPFKSYALLFRQFNLVALTYPFFATLILGMLIYEYT